MFGLKIVRKAPKWSTLLADLHSQEADKASDAITRDDMDAYAIHRGHMEGIGYAHKRLREGMWPT